MLINSIHYFPSDLPFHVPGVGIHGASKLCQVSWRLLKTVGSPTKKRTAAKTKKDPLDGIGVNDFYGRKRDSPIRKAKLVIRARKRRSQFVSIGEKQHQKGAAKKVLRVIDLKEKGGEEDEILSIVRTNFRQCSCEDSNCTQGSDHGHYDRTADVSEILGKYSISSSKFLMQFHNLYKYKSR